MIPWVGQGQHLDREVRLSRLASLTSLDLPRRSLSDSTVLIINRSDSLHASIIEGAVHKLIDATPLAVATAGHQAALMWKAIEDAMNPQTPVIMAAYYDSDCIADILGCFFYASFPAESLFANWTRLWVIVVGDTSAADVCQCLNAFTTL